MRLLPDGSPDSTFGSAGVAVANFSVHDETRAAAVDGSGRIVAGGDTDNGAASNVFVTRFLADGSADPTFAGGTGFLLDLGGQEMCVALLVMPDGRILAAGWTDHGGEAAFLLIVLKDDGTLDTSVGTGGVIELDVVPGQDDKAWGLALDPLGRVLVFGATSDGTQNDIAVVRLLP